MGLESDAQRVAEALQAFENKASNRQGAVLRQPKSDIIIERLELKRLVEEGGLTGDVLSRFVESYLEASITLRDPRNMGHQTAYTNIAASMATFIDGFAINPMAINEMGPAGSALEQFYLDWMMSKVGWDYRPEAEIRSGGVLTHGGSLANLTALCSARSALIPKAWNEGVPANVVVIAPQGAHYSIARAVGIMGLGQDALISLPVDEDGRSRADMLEGLITSQRAMGNLVMAVVAGSCQTASGLFDPIRDMAMICQKMGVWLHVDGAHGAAALLSPRFKHLMDGVELADSLVWDAHKMLRTPCLCAALLMKDHRALDGTFSQNASYLFHEKENPGFDFVSRSVECTKSGLGLKAFMALAQDGEAGMTRYIEGLIDLTKQAANWIEGLEDFEIAVKPEFNILCFKMTKGDEISSLKLRKAILSRGQYYVTFTEYKGSEWLRLTLMNARTNMDDIKSLIEEVRYVSLALVQGQEMIEPAS